MGEGDKFIYNKEFTAQLFRIKINSIQLKESPEENQKTNQQVIQDRQYMVRTAQSRPFLRWTRRLLSQADV